MHSFAFKNDGVARRSDKPNSKCAAVQLLWATKKINTFSHGKALNTNDKQRVKPLHSVSTHPKFCHFFKSVKPIDNDQERHSTLEHMGNQTEN